MQTFGLAARALLYMTAFVWLFGWLALRVSALDAKFGLGLPAWARWPGPLLMAAGGMVVVRCAVEFVLRGRGTPAIFDAPRRFVASGPYRFVRNPMYLGGLGLLAGFGLCLRSGAVLVFGGAMFLFLHLFVVFYEEPVLKKQFGASYEDYLNTTHRWLPKRPARRTAPTS
jgi:protein-S-isoprenylcysteine O-methyltransferase Ste14